MKILIVAPRYCKPGDFYNMPLGLGYIISALKVAGFEVHCLNCNHTAEPTGIQVERMVRLLDPQVCATGALSPFLPEVQEVFDAARRAKPSIVNIAGGGVLSSDPEAGLSVMDIDIGTIGEGEATIVDVVRTLQSGGDLAGVFGIVFRNHRGDVIRTIPRPSINELDTIAWPDYEALGFEKLLELQRPSDAYFYHPFDRPRGIDMIASRSCPYRCTFCFHPTGKVYRERPLDDFFAELDHLVAKYQINCVTLIDELFSLKRARLMEFCDRIEPYKLHWTVQLHVNCAEDHVLQRMKETGGTYISYGVESMSQEVLISMQKKSKKERIHSVLANTRKHKIGIQGNLIFGDTAETIETANESMQWWAENREHKIWINRLLVYPGSPDYIEAVKDGLIKNRLDFIEDDASVFINISKMNDEALDALTLKVRMADWTLIDLARTIRFEKQPEPDVRGDAYHIEWGCPRCEHHNDFHNVILSMPNDRHKIRLTCRGCYSRFDVRNPFEIAFESRETHRQDEADHRAALDLMAAGQEKAGIAALETLATRHVWYYPSQLVLGDYYRDRGQKFLALKHHVLALMHHPFDVERQMTFADHMMWEGSLGLARLHYLQALKLDPGNIDAAKKLASIDSGDFTDAQRQTYFMSYSDKAPPKRLRDAPEGCGKRRDEQEFPDIAKLEERAKEEMALAG